MWDLMIQLMGRKVKIFHRENKTPQEDASRMQNWQYFLYVSSYLFSIQGCEIRVAASGLLWLWGSGDKLAHLGNRDEYNVRLLHAGKKGQNCYCGIASHLGTLALRPETLLKSILLISRGFGGGLVVKQCSVRDLCYTDEWSFHVSGPNKGRGNFVLFGVSL